MSTQSNQELYAAYTEAKARVDILHEQNDLIAQQLYAAENELMALESQVRALSDNAFMQSLIGE